MSADGVAEATRRMVEHGENALAVRAFETNYAQLEQILATGSGGVIPEDTIDPLTDVPALDDVRRFRAALAEALGQVQLPVRSVLARPELSVDALLALKPGDVIPISLGPRVPLLVANRRVAEGTIGEQEGRAALMIEMVGRDA